MLTFKEKYLTLTQYIFDNFSFNQESFEKTFSVSLDPLIQHNQDQTIAILEYDFYFFSLEPDFQHNTINLIRTPNLNLDKDKFLAIRTLTKDQRVIFDSLNNKLSDEVYNFANQCLIENNKKFISFLMTSKNFYFKHIINYGLQEKHIDTLLEFINSESLIQNF